MNITNIGRVEFDPMLIPTSTVTSQDTGVSFEETLEKTVEQRDAVEQSSAQADADASTEPEFEPESATETQDSQPTTDSESKADTASQQNSRGSETMPREGTEPADNKNPEAGAPVRRENASKGAGAPASHFSTANSDKAAEAGEFTPSSSNGTGTEVGSAAGASVAQANQVTATRPTSTSFEEIGASLRFAKSSAAAGYRSTTKQALEMAEAARDSVFKQIAMNLTPQGGEMVMLLDPPELGKLDISLTIENGNVARLTIGAERPELAAMLEKHMAELREQLESQGIIVDSTEVHARDNNSQNRPGQNGKQNSNDSSDNHDDANTDPWERVKADPGFITADGIRIWA